MSERTDVNGARHLRLARAADGAPSAVDQLLARARLRLNRLEPAQAAAAVSAGALLIDIRPAENRDREGEIPGAVVIDRNVLEWRLDPTCEARLPIARANLTPIVFCNEGYASSFAARDLQDIGLAQATDLIGGYRAWRAAGFPVTVGS